MELDFRWLGRVEYTAGLETQNQLAAGRRAGKVPDTILFLEHEPVYTIGRTRDRSSLLDAARLPHPVVEINRGGQATYHGPGQLVGYLILDLHPYGCDLHTYLRAIEQAIIDTAAHWDVCASRREGLTGVWTEARKLASIGVGVRHWVSMHGFALNVSRNLEGFGAIVPCGIQGVEMTSIERETRKTVTVEEVAHQMKPDLERQLEQLQNAVAGK